MVIFGKALINLNYFIGNQGNYPFIMIDYGDFETIQYVKDSFLSHESCQNLKFTHSIALLSHFLFFVTHYRSLICVTGFIGDFFIYF